MVAEFLDRSTGAEMSISKLPNIVKECPLTLKELSVSKEVQTMNDLLTRIQSTVTALANDGPVQVPVSVITLPPAGTLQNAPQKIQGNLLANPGVSAAQVNRNFQTKSNLEGRNLIRKKDPQEYRRMLEQQMMEEQERRVREKARQRESRMISMPDSQNQAKPSLSKDSAVVFNF